MIGAGDLIYKFRYALVNAWGYIWGTAGDKWTQGKQNQKVDYMISRYGENWKKNADAENDSYYSAALNGSKWIGHMVADCSGLFSWAFKQLGGYMYHGSDTMFRKYCTESGALSGGKRTDGKELLPGTAVFTYNEKKKNYGHVGLYVGNGSVIEASGTIAGVCTSNVAASKWKYWGELVNVDYSQQNSEIPVADEPVGERPGQGLPTLKRGCKGEYVTVLQTKLVNKGYDIGPCGVDGDFGSATLKAVKQFQKDHGLDADGIVGKKTWEELDKPGTNLYTVTIPHLTKFKAEAFLKEYSGASMLEEK